MKLDTTKTTEEIFPMDLGGTYSVLKNYDEDADRLVAEFHYADSPEVIEVVSTPDESTVRYLDRFGATRRLVYADSAVDAMKIAHESARTQ